MRTNTTAKLPSVVQMPAAASRSTKPGRLKFVMFYHSLISDWNHGNAHFLRGVARELILRGHEVTIYEPHNAWSVQNLLAENGTAAIRDFEEIYPELSSIRYNPATLDMDLALDDADVVIVHEWNDHRLVKRVGQHRKTDGSYLLLFHDTHHRCVTARADMAEYDLSQYDGVLAFGNIVRDIYLEEGWARNAWTWHEAADTLLFHPMPQIAKTGDLVWIGNWGDEERTLELDEFLLRPAADLKLIARAYGVRYPQHGLDALSRAGIRYCGWLANYKVPRVFAQHRVTVHVPRRPYVQALPGIPTIRPFEAMACGIPLVSAPWEDAEGLFAPGEDFLVARNRKEMNQHLRDLLNDAELAEAVAASGLRRIRERHTCAHRTIELLNVVAELSIPATKAVTA